MDGESRKRKLENDVKEEEEEEEEDEEDEEQKVEKFFALIKRAGEAHRYIAKTNLQERNKIKQWQATFQSEDFIQKDAHNHHKLNDQSAINAITPPPPGPSKRKDEPTEGVADIHEDGLDLNLSL